MTEWIQRFAGHATPDGRLVGLLHRALRMGKGHAERHLAARPRLPAAR